MNSRFSIPIQSFAESLQSSPSNLRKQTRHIRASVKDRSAQSGQTLVRLFSSAHTTKTPRKPRKKTSQKAVPTLVRCRMMAASTNDTTHHANAIIHTNVTRTSPSVLQCIPTTPPFCGVDYMVAALSPQQSSTGINPEYGIPNFGETPCRTENTHSHSAKLPSQLVNGTSTRTEFSPLDFEPSVRVTLPAAGQRVCVQRRPFSKIAESPSRQRSRHNSRFPAALNSTESAPDAHGCRRSRARCAWHKLPPSTPQTRLTGDPAQPARQRSIEANGCSTFSTPLNIVQVTLALRTADRSSWNGQGA